MNAFTSSRTYYNNSIRGGGPKFNGAKTDWIISLGLRHDVNGRFICNSNCDLVLRRFSDTKQQTITQIGK